MISPLNIATQHTDRASGQVGEILNWSLTFEEQSWHYVMYDLRRIVYQFTTF